MMKKLVILSEESIFSGILKSGVAEVVDTLANSLTSNYEVSIICPNGGGTIPFLFQDVYQYNEYTQYTQFSQVHYYMIDQDNFYNNAKNLLKTIEMDIFHNFSTFGDLINYVPEGVKTLLTYDNYKIYLGTDEVLNKYDYIVAPSDSYLIETLESNSDLGEYLRMHRSKVLAITHGISETLFNPKEGVLTLTGYSSDYQEGKKMCKRQLLQSYGLKDAPCVYLMMCRLVKDKNIEAVIEALPEIKKNNGVVVVVGQGDNYYKQLLEKYRLEDGLFFLKRPASPANAPALLAAADFYLSPSLYEPCGLMPMTAAIYGAIPIVSQVGGLQDNFNDDNAIVIKDSLKNTIQQVADLYNDKDALFQKRKTCMEQTHFYWKDRKSKYIELYED